MKKKIKLKNEIKNKLFDATILTVLYAVVIMAVLAIGGR